MSNGLQNKQSATGLIQVNSEFYSRFEEAVAKTAGRSEGFKLTYPYILGNTETKLLFVPDTNDARVYISGAGAESDGISQIPKIGIPKEYLIYGQPIRVRKNTSGNWVFDKLDTDTAEIYNAGDADKHNQTIVDVSQFDFATLRPYSGMIGVVKGFIYGDNAVIDLATADFSTSPDDTLSNPIDIPSTANRAIMVLVQLDTATSILSYKQSVEFSSGVSLSEYYRQNWQEVGFPLRDVGKKRVGYIKLANGVTELNDSNIWTVPEFFPDIDTSALVSFGFADATTLTIASGSITPTQAYHKVDTEGGAGTDFLDTITAGTEGQMLFLRSVSAARVTTIRHANDNIFTSGVNDIVLDQTYKVIQLICDGTDWSVIAYYAMPNDVGAWGSFPDFSLKFSGQFTDGTLYGVRGDEMRMHEIWDVTGGDLAADSSSEMNFIFDDATDRTVTLSNILGGHSLKAKARQVSGGTGHKILLPVSCGWNGTSDRALLLDATTDWVIAVATSATNYEVMASVGVTYAAS
jgi:hypothetical protein